MSTGNSSSYGSVTQGCITVRRPPKALHNAPLYVHDRGLCLHIFMLLSKKRGKQMYVWKICYAKRRTFMA